MQIRGNGIAIALGALALAIAATGTAYAVTATQVQIVDGTTGTHAVSVDAAGHLSVAPPRSKIQILAYAYSSLISNTAPVTSPTTASLAVTAFEYNNIRNAPQPNLDYIGVLVKITVGSGGTCSDSDATFNNVREDGLVHGRLGRGNVLVAVGVHRDSEEAVLLRREVHRVGERPRGHPVPGWHNPGRLFSSRFLHRRGHWQRACCTRAGPPPRDELSRSGSACSALIPRLEVASMSRFRLAFARKAANDPLQEALMGILQALVALVALYGAERAAHLWRKTRLEKRRAAAEYPITGNDPTGNLIA